MYRHKCEVYIYDTLGQCKESDDPLESSVVYSNYPDNEEHLLIMTGQLMGIATFGNSTFGFPSKIHLQNGSNFRLSKHGRFILVVGEIAGVDDDSEIRVKELCGELEDRLRFFRGTNLDSWFTENPFQFRIRVNRFANAVLRNSFVYYRCTEKGGFFKDDLDSSDLENTEICDSILCRCLKSHEGILCGSLHKEGKVLHHNFPRKVLKNLEILFNDKEKSLDTSFCKVYKNYEERLPVGIDLFFLYPTLDELREMRFTKSHLLHRSISLSTKSLSASVNDPAPKTISEETDGGKNLIMLVMKVDLVRLLLLVVMSGNSKEDSEIVRRVWNIGFHQLPKLVDPASESSDS